MRFHRVAAAIALSFSLSLSAQMSPPPERQEAGGGVTATPVAEPQAAAEAPAPTVSTAGTTSPRLRVATDSSIDTSTNDIKMWLGTNDSTSAFTVFSLSGGPRFVVRGDGSVGIGTATPAEKLDIVGDMSITGGIKSGSVTSHRTSEMRWTNIGGPHTGYVKLVTPIVATESNMFTIFIEGYRYQNGSDAFGIRCAGYAYGGPAGLVSTNCDVNGTDLPVEMTSEIRPGTTDPVVVIMIGTPSTSWFYAHFAAEYSGWKPKNPASFVWVGGETTPAPGANVNNTFLNDKLGTARIGSRLGIGGEPHATHRLYTTGPSDVTTFAGTPVSIGLKSSHPFSTTNNGAGIAFDAIFNSGGSTTTVGVVSGVKENTTDGDYAGALTFGTRASATGAVPMERMRIRSTGEVSIGQPTQALTQPTLLTVNGNIVASGSITGVKVFNAVYQDLAEWVPATTDMAPGTVVVLNVAKGNEVMPSSAPYDTTVAGVVSAQPGIVLGVAGEEKEQIATTGRVKVRVDARNAPIRVGDLLVTSSVPGTAMRSEPMAINGRNFHQPGTIIGKALEPLENGTGEILVLLSMQ